MGVVIKVLVALGVGQDTDGAPMCIANTLTFRYTATATPSPASSRTSTGFTSGSIYGTDNGGGVNRYSNSLSTQK